MPKRTVEELKSEWIAAQLENHLIVKDGYERQRDLLARAVKALAGTSEGEELAKEMTALYEELTPRFRQSTKRLEGLRAEAEKLHLDLPVESQRVGFRPFDD